MIDLKLIREDPEGIKALLKRRGAEDLVTDVLAADERRRELVFKLDSKRADQNDASRAVGKLSPDERPGALETAKRIKAEVEALEPQVAAADEQLTMLMLQLPNLPDDRSPDGTSDEDNTELRKWGNPRVSEDQRDHLDIGRALGWIDTDRAARTSGTRFGYLMGEAVRLEFALIGFAFDRLVTEGFKLVVPPVLVRREVMQGAGALPGDEAQFYTVQDGQYLVGTSEQALAALHMEETLAVAELPLRYAAFSTCFRREAGAYGRDTRGIFRVHQFDKVEMFSFVEKAESQREHDFLISVQEGILQALEIPYRAVDVCVSELGDPAARKVDIEAWFPSQKRYREVMSCSNCTDFQSRRLKIRTDNKELVHTLNGTAVAIQRMIAAILENFVSDDGSVSVPSALGPYIGPRN